MNIRRPTDDDDDDDDCKKRTSTSTETVGLYAADVPNGSSRLPAGDCDSDSSGSRKAISSVSSPKAGSNSGDLSHYQPSPFLLHENPTFYLRTFHNIAGDRNTDSNSDSNRQLYLRTNNDSSISNSWTNKLRGGGGSVSGPAATGTRNPKCAKCRNHGFEFSVKNHKRYCPFMNCQCDECLVVSHRQKVMALQVKVRRAQQQDFEQAKMGIRPIHDSALLRLRLRSDIMIQSRPPNPDPVMQRFSALSPAAFPPKSGTMSQAECNRRYEALLQMMESFKNQGGDPILICSYIILKEYDFAFEKAYEKIIEARNDIRGSYTVRDPSGLVASSAGNCWQSVVPQAATSPSSALIYPPLNYLSNYYSYPFPGAPTASAGAAAGGTGHPLLTAASIPLCTYVPPGSQHPSSSSSALNSVTSSLGAPGPPPPLMEIHTSGDSRGSDCRDAESDAEAAPPSTKRRRPGVEPNEDVHSDHTPPGTSTEDAPETRPSLRGGGFPMSYGGLHSTYKNRPQSIES